MKIIVIILSFVAIQAQAQNKTSFINAIEFELGKEISYLANLNEGKYLDDLSWAWKSNNACFPKTQKLKFTGKHILFTGIMPAHSEVRITITPTDKRANFSVYAYQINTEEDFVVPNLPHCIACEADHKWDYKKRGRPNQDHTRKVEDFIAIDNSYRIVIGVTAANMLDEGEFVLKIETMKL